MMGLASVLAVALGGACGALIRWAVALASERLARPRLSPGVPWPTFVANALACFWLGLVITWFGSAASGGGHLLYLLLGAGLGGGLSVLSAFALEVVSLARRGALVVALGYATLSSGVGMVALWLGLVLAG